ncbi:signal recognition particle protein Srp19, partial [Candidatus Micrarchaeota archaeon]|nr:signal recognition particle protein Srp19 [Candidatus Micrarchaeota archaeon]
RSALDQELVKEIKEVNSALKPDLTLLVLGADIGQIAGKQAKAFHESVGVNGVIITKMDGSAKGGGTLIACSITNAPVYFIGTGEKMQDLEEFDSTRYLSRIMGYGDLQGLLEKVKEATEDEEVDLEELMKKEFNLDIFYKQLKAARKMGPLNKVMDMMGMGQQIPKEQMELGEEKLDAFKVIMDSMTQKEKLEPELLNHSRIQRIAKGAGKKEEDVRELIKHYKQMKKVFKQMKKLSDPKMLEKKGALDKLMKKFGKKKKVKFR